ncbi:hypothetical protein [Rhizobium leguminosarum]|uniref:hypothetical protein n=1 Tax=Rhizobium leguminosarum TaxID=384 RepID=UPI001AE9BF66|nr:hypothetical protein [Rhizobium leguminosarum]MBP2442837.1 hypothetical protein [Rhizobium leguminosarum]
MPRNPSTGVYSKPAGTTPSVGQLIDPAPWNALTTDLGNEITNSLPRDGSAPMVAALKVADGSVAAPGVGFASNPGTGTYLKAAGIGALVASGVEIANWSSAGLAITGSLSGSVIYGAKSAGYTAVAADAGTVLRFTAAATLSLTAAATLGSGWLVTIIADGGAITIDPNASELINGLATATIPQGGSVNIICDGTAFYTYAKPSAWEPVGSPITLSGQSSVSWTSLDAYRHLRISLGYVPSPGSGNVLLRVSTDNGSSFISTSTYSSSSLAQTGTTVTGTANAASTAMIVSNTGVDANSGFLSSIEVSNFNKAAAASYKVISEYASGNPRIDLVYGGHSGSTARNALQILVSSGNFTSGMVLLEGLRG